MVPGNLAHVDKVIMAIHGKITEKEESSTVPTSKAQEGPQVTSIQGADSSTEVEHYCRKTFYGPEPTNQNYLLLSYFFFLKFWTI